MTSATIAARLREARTGVAIGKDEVALGALSLFASALALLTWQTWGDLDSDTGYDTLAGIHVARGELPYVDFVYYYGPLSAFLSGLAAFVGGDGFGPSVALGLGLTAAILAATYALARVVAGTVGALLAAALTAAVAFIPDNYSFVLPHTFAAPLGTLLVLLLLLSVWRYAETERPAWLLTAGVLLGLTTLTKPEAAGAAVVAVMIWLVIRRRLTSRDALVVLAPAVVIPAVVYGAFAAAAGASDLLFKNLYPVDSFEVARSTMLEARMPMTVGSLADLVGKLVLYAVGVSALIVLALLLSRPGRLRSAALAVCCIAATGVVAVSIARPDGLRDAAVYMYGWIPAGAILAAVLVVRRARRDGTAPPSSVQLEAAGVAALAVLAATTYASFVVHGWRPQMAVYYLPLAAIFLARLHLVELAPGRPGRVLGVLWLSFLVASAAGLTLKAAGDESVVVRGPGGALAETPVEARAYERALQWIAAETEPGDPILVAPLMTALHPLSGRETPLQELTTVPGALPTDADEREAIRRLETAGVRLAITDRRRWPGYGHGAFGTTFHGRLSDWIDTNFARVTVIRSGSGEDTRTFDVWLKRRDP